VQKRRALFWELFITDGWQARSLSPLIPYLHLTFSFLDQSLATGRLATFSLPFVDCELPYDPNETLANDGTIQPSCQYQLFHNPLFVTHIRRPVVPFWKARFGAECVSAVVQGTLTSRAPKYSIILELDRKIRDMELPKYAQGPVPEGAGLAQTMSHFMPHNYRQLS